MDGRRLTRRTVVAAAASLFALGARSRVAADESVADGADLDFGVGRATRKPVRVSPPEPVTTWRTGVIGTSVEGRTIERWDFTPEAPKRHVTVVCGVHGDERAAVDFAAQCSFIEVPEDMHYTIIPLLNPDGWAAGTRNNANDIDINRNFDWGWSPSLYFSGDEPTSEPETQAIMDFLSIKRPDLVIWVHQPLGYVAALDGCPPDYASLWSNVAGVPNRRGVRQAGGGETWASEELELASMLIEIGGVRDAPEDVASHVEALETLLPFVRVHPT